MWIIFLILFGFLINNALSRTNIEGSPASENRHLTCVTFDSSCLKEQFIQKSSPHLLTPMPMEIWVKFLSTKHFWSLTAAQLCRILIKN